MKKPLICVLPAAITAVILSLGITACSPGAGATGTRTTDSGASANTSPIKSVYLLGDSVAKNVGLPLGPALMAEGITLTDGTGDGSAFTVIPGSIDKAVQDVSAAKPDLVILQTGVLDSAPEADQISTYADLADKITATGAKLLIVNNPPIKEDSSSPFQNAEALTALARLPKVAADVAKASPDTVKYLDTSSIWGTSFKAKADDGSLVRSPDGTHICPAGAAIFANWMTAQLHSLYGTPKPGDASKWIDGSWRNDPSYTLIACS